MRSLALLVLAASLGVSSSAESPQISRVRAALAEALGPRGSGLAADAPLKSFTDPLLPAERSAVKSRLDALDLHAATAAERAELQEAYTLLGYDSRADFSVDRTPKPEIAAHTRQNADVTARALLSGLDRDAGSPVGAGAATTPKAPVPGGAPFILPVKAGKTASPPPLDALGYVTEGTTPPGFLARTYANAVQLTSYAFHNTTAEERARLTALQSRLATTETGRALIAEFGGTDAITKNVNIRFANTGSANLNAYTIPLKLPDATGHRFALILNTALLKESDDVVVPILAHELRHVRDGMTEGSLDGGLAIPSEFAAHATQVHVYEDMLRGTPDNRREALHPDSKRWAYQVFLARIWEDHITERYPTRDAFAAIFTNMRYRQVAYKVYDDLKNGVVHPGTPQIYYHLTAPQDGLYSLFMRSETDALSAVAARRKMTGYTPEMRAEDDALLKKRTAIINRSEAADHAYRSLHGFVVADSVR